jgi:selenide, water dikinase
VTGLVDPRRMLTNAGGRPGQVLVLTKPLGTGIIATALKAGAAPAEAAEASAASMRELNRAAAEAALRHGVTGATDVTGFGLAGHAAAVARESRLTLEITSAALPLLPGVLELALRFQAGGLAANRRAFEPQVEYDGALDERLAALVFDPQTSGGLLLLVPEETVGALLAELPAARAIGRARERGSRALVVRAA